MIVVRDYHPNLKQYFVDMNLEWLNHFFWVEEHDKQVLNNCEVTILEPGGHIFFFEENGDILGTYAFLKMDNKRFEFTKMAVQPHARGRGIGNFMMQHACAFAKSKEWEEIVIYSNTILENAIYLYKKYGFQEIKMEKDGPYERGDIKLKYQVR